MSNNNAVLARNTEKAPINSLYSQTVAFSHYNNLSAQLPVDPKSGKLVAGGIKEQAEQCFKNIEAIVDSIDHVMNDIVRITVFVKNIKDVDTVNEVYKTFFSSYLPTQTIVAVDALPMNALVQIEALVSNGEGTIPGAPQAGDLIKLTNNTENAPMSSLSTQTVAFSHYNNISAQLPVDPKTNEIVAGGIKEQTEQCLKNIKAIVESVDHVLEDTVKINIFLKNIEDIEAVNEIYAKFYPSGTPARRIVGVSALQKNALIQIDAILGNAEGTPPIK